MSVAVQRPNHKLSTPASRFIGRAADLAALARLFGEGRRLVTLWGPAGMGKTRLAQEFALACAAARPDESVWFCGLEDARDLKAFCGRVARSLGAAVTAGRKDAGTVARIGESLAVRGPSLLVLDNLEQVLEPSASAIGAWMRAAPEVRFLVTSRERSHLPGEVSYELAPLSLPEPDGGAQGSEAVELFLDRVNLHRPMSPVGDESATQVAALVRKLEGIPLAIELAAARADVLGLDDLLARLERRLDLLGGLRGVDARQATMRNAIEWSWDLLDEPDRRALSLCSVFRGGFTLAAADAVLGGPALDRIQLLRDKSLLRAIAKGTRGAVRFSLYEAVRQLAAEKLIEGGEQDLAGARHTDHYLAAGEAQATEWERTGAVFALDRIGDDLGNLLAVVERALDRPPSRAAAEEALRALLVIDPVLAMRGPFGIHFEMLDRALETARATSADPLLEARALSARGRARHLRGQDAAGLSDLERARARAAALGAASVEAGIVTDLGILHHKLHALEKTRACYEEALALHRRSGDRRGEGRLLGNLGALHHDEGRFDEAMRHYEPALAISAAAGDHRTEGIFSTNAALVDQERGATTQARHRYERAVAILEEVGDLRLLAITLGNLGVLHHEDGRLDEARQSHERATALLRKVGDRRSEALAEGRMGAALAALDRTDEARACLDRGERILAQLGDPVRAEILSVARGFLDLTLARRARAEARAAEATEHLEGARRRIARAREGAPSLADGSDDIRLLLRILERNLSAVDGTTAPRLELLLAREGRWYRPPGGDWQDLRERHPVRRLLVRLAERQRDAPGRGVSLAELREAGWPSERMLSAAASNRIYVAVNHLRRLGLKEWLKRSGDGYFLDPALPIHYTSVEPG